jgi:aspartate/methionine/tyrosine aminotransferase
MTADPIGSYLRWARDNAGRQRLCLRGSGMPGRALPSPLPPLPQQPAGHHDDLWLEGQVARAVAGDAGIGPERVFVTLGTSGANLAVLRALLATPGDRSPGELLCERPCYDPLWRTGQALGCPVRTFDRRPEEGWRLDPVAIEAQLSHRTRAIILARPHNPTGVGIPEDVLASLGELAEIHDLHVVVDEVYLGFVPGARPAALLHPRLISTASLTKVYGLSELRLGWVLASEGLVATMTEQRLHGEALLPALPLALGLALWPQLEAWRHQAREHARAGARELAALADLPGTLVSEPAGTPFAFLHTGSDDLALARRLEARGVGVTPGSLFQAPGGIRIGWTRPLTELREALPILRETILEPA